MFTERPQDLLEFIDYWKSNGRLGRHAEMLDFNIQVKLREHDLDRDTRRPLSTDDALLGAERLAATIIFQKKRIKSTFNVLEVTPLEISWPACKSYGFRIV